MNVSRRNRLQSHPQVAPNWHRTASTCVLLLSLAGVAHAEPCGPPSAGLFRPELVELRDQKTIVESRGRLYFQLGLPAAVDLISTEIKLATDPSARERNVLFGQNRAHRIGYNVAATLVGTELARLLQKHGIGWGAKVIKGASISMHGVGIVLTWR